jgi:hypothetical protein
VQVMSGHLIRIAPARIVEAFLNSPAKNPRQFWLLFVLSFGIGPLSLSGTPSYKNQPSDGS